MKRTLEKSDWDILLSRIAHKKCTPFIGAGMAYGILPLGGEIAETWSKEYDYPLDDRSNLPRVAQYVAVKKDPMYPKYQIIDQWFSDLKPPDFGQPDEPHAALAQLPLPIYITTNYDNFMTLALENVGKDPKQMLCPWNQNSRDINTKSEIDFDTLTPTAANPLVFHLHGSKEHVESLVLTESDYLDFMVNISKNKMLIPPYIQEALSSTSLLFLGYSLQDWNFRVLFRTLVERKEDTLRHRSVAVQVLPSDEPELRDYIDEYFSEMKISVYLGTAKEFVTELQQQWKNHKS